ncbi:MAG: SurA N-terminal domain-containing protein, partial [Candidatus Binatia bacterium]|nr:SurA N-terminal domain-containing protein [Candidatus Binatia bacterium]
MTSQEPWTRWRALCLLAVGAALGVACGVGSVLRASQPEGDTVPEGVIALVNGKAIAMEDYARAVAMVASDKRGEITAADRAEVLRRLIDEELLIQYGIEIGLVESHRAVRQAIAQAMLAAIVSEHASERPSEEALRAFYDKNRSLFVRPLRGGSTRMSTETEEGPLPFDEVRTQ